MSDSLDYMSTAPAEDLLLGRISGWELPRPLFDVWLLGRLEQQRAVEDAQQAAREASARLASPEPFDIAGLLRPSFAELCERRGETDRAARARSHSAFREVA